MTERNDALDRRTALKGFMALLAGGTAGTLIGTEEAAARENREGDLCLTVLFPNGEDAEFDFEYYVNEHVPMVVKLYDGAIRRYEIFEPQTGPDGEPPQYLAITNIWIADQDAFAKASAEHRDEFAPDVKNFTNVSPTGQMHRLRSVIAG